MPPSPTRRLSFIEQDRERKPSTLRDYPSCLKVHLLPVLGDRALESITEADIEAWRRGLSPELSNRMKNSQGAVRQRTLSGTEP